MTEGLPAVAAGHDAGGGGRARLLRGCAKGRRTVWVPATLRFVFVGFRHLPGAVWRRLDL